VPGYASLLVTITFLSGIQLIVIGMVGQYVARIYDEARGRPLYLVREARGFDGSVNGKSRAVPSQAVGQPQAPGEPDPRVRAK
jgi:catabolite regulation protein CreA